jgi:hypothetical protein
VARRPRCTFATSLAVQVEVKSVGYFRRPRLDEGDVLLEELPALVVEADPADAHVLRRGPVGPGHLPAQLQLGAEVGEVEHHIDRRAHLDQVRRLDADAAQRDVLDAVVEEDVVALHIHVSVDLVARMRARFLDHRQALLPARPSQGDEAARSIAIELGNSSFAGTCAAGRAGC